MSMLAERADLRSRRLDPVPEPWRQRIALLEDENAALRDRGQQLEREQRRLRREQRQLRERIEGLEAERDRLGAEAERLERVNARLREQVERSRREAKRQAAATLEHTAPAKTYGAEAERIATALAAARQRLGDAAYARAQAAGEGTALEEAADQAMQLLAEHSDGW